MSRHAPPQILVALASDQPDIASLVLARSPLFTDDDLIDRVASSVGSVQRIIAGRPYVSMAVSAAIAELGEAEACVALLANSGADIATLSFHRIAERFGHLPTVRGALVADPRLPSDCRYMLLVTVGEALRQSPLVAASIGPVRAERVMRDACVKASLTLIDGIRFDEHAALVEHLRLRGELTSAFIVRIIAHGKIDFFGSVLVALTRQNRERVTALLAAGRDVALAALFRAAGLPASMDQVVLCALKAWRDVAGGKRIAGAQEVSWLMLRELGERPADTKLAGLLKSIHLEALRGNAREHALAIAAA